MGVGVSDRSTGPPTMRPAERATPAWAGVAAAGSGVFLGLAAVGVASRGRIGDAGRAAFSPAASDAWLLGGFTVAVVATTAVVVWAMWPDGRAKAERAPRSWWRHYAVSLVVLLLLVLVGGLRERVFDEPASGASSPTIVGTPSPEATTEPVEDGLRPSVLASITLGVLVVAAVTGLAVLSVARRRGRDGQAEAGGDERRGIEPDAEAAGRIDVTGRSEDDVAREPDPRRAVLLAYALLEARLEGTVAARHPAASPHEWMRAIAGALDPETVSAAATLTDLYERARFSIRPLTRDDRAIAVGALRRALVPAQPSTSTSGAASR